MYKTKVLSSYTSSIAYEYTTSVQGNTIIGCKVSEGPIVQTKKCTITNRTVSQTRVNKHDIGGDKIGTPT